jgi:hypothetical protein
MTGGHVLPTPVNRLPFSYVWGLPQFPSAKLKVNIQKKSSFAYEPDSLNEATHKLANEFLPNYFFMILVRIHLMLVVKYQKFSFHYQN